MGLEVLEVEVELVSRRKPAGDAGLKLLYELVADVEVGEAGAPAEPFEGACRVEVGLAGPQVHRDLAGALIAVDEEERSRSVRYVGQRIQVLDVAGGVEHVAGRQESCAIVDGFGELLWIDPHSIVAGEDHELHVGLHGPLVGQGGEVELCADHAVPPAVVDALGDDGECGGRGGE